MVNSSSADCRQGDCGPFRPGLPVSVPLWLALSLRQRQRCRIVRPDWLQLQTLEEVENCSLNRLPDSALYRAGQGR